MGMAFGISEDDIENVLRRNWAKVDAQGESFEKMAERLFNEIDHDRVESAALDSGDDLGEQTDGAYQEIETILVEMGIMKAPAPQPAPRN